MVSLPTFHDIQQAAACLDGVVVHTPALPWDRICPGRYRDVWLKCEQVQRTGAFKFRGAYHALVKRHDYSPAKMVVTLSSGNHGQGLAGQLLGYAVQVVMPEPINAFKRERIEQWGATVHVAPDRNEGRRMARDLADRLPAAFIHPFNDPDVIAGQGTAALELLKDIPDLDVLLAPVGGGGLLSGTCLAAHGMRPGMKVYGCEPAHALDVKESIQAGAVRSPCRIDTIAEGLRTSLGEMTLAILKEHLEDVFVVDEHEIVSAMKTAFEHLKQVIEPSAAVALAPLLRGEPSLRGKRAGGPAFRREYSVDGLSTVVGSTRG